MKNKIRFLCIVLGILCVLHIPLHTSADVIYFPADPFFEENYEECRKVNHDFLVNSPDGYATVYESPVSDQEKGRLENGTTLYVRYIYDDPETGMSWYHFEEDTHGWILAYQLEYIDETPAETTVAQDPVPETTAAEKPVPETTKEERTQPMQTENFLEYLTLGLWIAALAAVTYVLLLLLKRK